MNSYHRVSFEQFSDPLTIKESAAMEAENTHHIRIEGFQYSREGMSVLQNLDLYVTEEQLTEIHFSIGVYLQELDEQRKEKMRDILDEPLPTEI